MQKWRNFEFGQVQIDDACKTIPKGMGRKILLVSHEIIKVYWGYWKPPIKILVQGNKNMFQILKTQLMNGG